MRARSSGWVMVSGARSVTAALMSVDDEAGADGDRAHALVPARSGGRHGSGPGPRTCSPRRGRSAAVFTRCPDSETIVTTRPRPQRDELRPGRPDQPQRRLDVDLEQRVEVVVRRPRSRVFGIMMPALATMASIRPKRSTAAVDPGRLAGAVHGIVGMDLGRHRRSAAVGARPTETSQPLAGQRLDDGGADAAIAARDQGHPDARSWPHSHR